MVDIMNEEPRNRVALVVGSLLIAVGVLVALDRTGVVVWTNRRNLWPIIFIAIGLAQLAYTYDSRPRRGFVFLLGGIWLLLNELNVMRFSNSWPLLLVAIGVTMAWDGWSPGRQLSPEERQLRERRQRELTPLVVIGLLVASLLIGDRARGMVQTSDSSDKVHVFAVLGGNRHVSVAHAFRGADLTTVMGGAVLDLRNTSIEPGQEASVDVFALMGGVTLYIPKDWVIDARALSVMGRIEDRRTGGSPRDDQGQNRRRFGRVDSESAAAESAPGESASPAPASTAPRLVIRGLVTMGGLVIRP
jgi:hypothetical protein